MTRRQRDDRLTACLVAPAQSFGGYAYHVLNRANGRLRLFKKDADFAAFEQVIEEACERMPLRILGYTVIGNHWHFVVGPKRGQDEQVSDFFRGCSGSTIFDCSHEEGLDRK